jgi:hypothetical protein
MVPPEEAEVVTGAVVTGAEEVTGVVVLELLEHPLRLREATRSTASKQKNTNETLRIGEPPYFNISY